MIRLTPRKLDTMDGRSFYVKHRLKYLKQQNYFCAFFLGFREKSLPFQRLLYRGAFPKPFLLKGRRRPGRCYFLQMQVILCYTECISPCR